jgi:hypothetical protein
MMQGEQIGHGQAPFRIPAYHGPRQTIASIARHHHAHNRSVPE